MQDRVGAIAVGQHREPRGALRVTVRDHDQHLQRGDLQRQTGVGAVVGGDLLSEKRGEFIIAGIEHVPRREPGQELDPAGVIVHLRERLAEAITRPGQTGVKGGHREPGQQPASIVAGPSLLERPLQVCRGGVRCATSRGVDRRVLQHLRGGTVAVRGALQ